MSLKLESADKLDEEGDLNIYYKVGEGGRPQIIAQRTGSGEVALMVQVMPSFLPEPQEDIALQVQYEDLP